MWRMAIFIHHICGERKNTLGHRCIKSIFLSHKIYFSSSLSLSDTLFLSLSLSPTLSCTLCLSLSLSLFSSLSFSLLISYLFTLYLQKSSISLSTSFILPLSSNWTLVWELFFKIRIGLTFIFFWLFSCRFRKCIFLTNLHCFIVDNNINEKCL